MHPPIAETEQSGGGEKIKKKSGRGTGRGTGRGKPRATGIVPLPLFPVFPVPVPPPVPLLGFLFPTSR